MQLILQATHGVVSGQPEFFTHAFGSSHDEFERILLLPHHFIFNREWYEFHGGRSEFEDFARQFSRLQSDERAELLFLLSSTDPRGFSGLSARATTPGLRKILRFYIPLGKSDEAQIWKTPRGAAAVPDDERVEDAGLNEDVVESIESNTSDLAEVPA
jgi:hypothetical protein